MKIVFKIVLLALTGMVFFGCESNNREVSVEGIIGRLDKSPICITYTNPAFETTHDTIRSSESGKFSFKIRVANQLNTITLHFIDKKCWTTLFANPGDDISINGSVEYVDLLTIKGGSVNDDLNHFKKEIATLYKERLDLLKRPYNNEKITDVRLAEIDLLLKRSAKEFIRENPSSVASVVLIQDFFYQEYDPVTVDLLAILTGEAATSRMAEKMRHSSRFRK